MTPTTRTARSVRRCRRTSANAASSWRLLVALTPEEWARGGTFTGAGRLLERTVLSEASAIVHHERPHIKQIERIVDIMRIED